MAVRLLTTGDGFVCSSQLTQEWFDHYVKMDEQYAEEQEHLEDAYGDE